MKKIIPIIPKALDNIKNSSKLVESWIPKLPSIYQIEVMSKCDFACDFCMTSHQNSPYTGDAKIDPELFNTIVKRDLGGSSFVELQYRGEPTLNKNLYKYVKALRQHVFVGFSTHGNLLHTVNAMTAALDSHYVTISIDAGEKELYENYRRGGNWELLISNITSLLKNKNTLYFPIIDLQLIEFEDVEEQIKNLKDLGNQLNWFTNETVQIRTVKDTQSNWINATSTLYNQELCTNPWYSVSIKANGDVVPCCMVFEDIEEMVYGNLKNNSLEEIWNSEKVKDFREQHRSGNITQYCSQCIARSPHNLHQNILNRIIKTRFLK